MNDQRDDKEFEAFLAGESGLTDSYRELGREEPPQELDAHILAEARKAAKVRRITFGPRSGWLKPVALAATVLLSFSLVMRVVIDTPARYEQIATPSKESRDRQDAESAAEVPQSVKVERKMAAAPSAALVEELAVNTPVAAGDASSVQSYGKSPESVARPVDRDTALLIVAEYVAEYAGEHFGGYSGKFTDEAEKAAIAGRAAAVEMEPGVARKQENFGSAMTSSAAADRDAEFDDEVQSDEGPESLLRDIERLNASGSTVAAGDRLDEFLRRYPDHPVSIEIRQLGY